MTFITITFVLLFITYNWLMKSTYGQLNSISQGYYFLQKKNMGIIFTLFTYLIAAYLFAVTVKTNNVLFFIGGIGAVFTGTAAEYKKRMTNVVHYIGSSLIIGGGAFGAWAEFGNWWAVAGIGLAGLSWLLIKKNPMYWFEIFSFIIIILSITL